MQKINSLILLHFEENIKKLNNIFFCCMWKEKLARGKQKTASTLRNEWSAPNKNKTW